MGIELLITDDHPVVRDGLKIILSAEPAFIVKKEFSNGRELTDWLSPGMSYIVLLDVSMPVQDGILTAQIINEQYPLVKVIALTVQGGEQLLKMLHAGVAGYLFKTASAEEIVSAIKAVAAGEQYFSSAVTSELSMLIKNQETSKNRDVELTVREKEILKWIANGKSAQEIADRLFISPRTVDTHRVNLMKKLGVHKISGLVRLAIELGYA